MKERIPKLLVYHFSFIAYSALNVNPLLLIMDDSSAPNTEGQLWQKTLKRRPWQPMP
jgi:hypothetical protein